ncbi:MAG: hypothetical protein MUF27_09485 [Acidobacteria bacterium]|jgi:hypothetical protein|nr:hypothetical protein [Acidobacteriota bacterium]
MIVRPRLLLLIGLALFSSAGSGQIPTRTVAPPTDTSKPPSFDGSRNFMGKAVIAYLGQDLFVPCLPPELREYGYRDFYTRCCGLAVPPHEIVYAMNDNYASSIEALAGRTFTVLEVIPHPKAVTDPLLYGSKFFFKLSAKDRPETLYFEYNAKYEHSFPFIVMHYFETQKAAFAGHAFITRGRNWIDSGPMLDIKTGKPVRFPPGEAWSVVDLVIEDRFCTLAVILRNSLGEEVPLPLTNIEKQKWAFSKEDADRYAERFGAETWAKILAGSVAIGMTAEQAELAWGEPESEHETIVEGKAVQQWVYKGNQYLYVEKGKVTGIQN